jgi:hypothetical protein
MIYDIWFIIFSLLDPEAQRRIRATCQLFNVLFGHYNNIRKNINNKKHVFYQYIGCKQIKVYKFESIEEKKKFNRLIFKVDGKRVLRKIIYDRNQTPYCRNPVNNKNEFVFKYDIDKIHNLFKTYCDKCWKLTECENEYCESNCGIFLCKKKNLHFHKVCQKCFKANSKKLNESLQFKQKKMFQKTDIIFV